MLYLNYVVIESCIIYCVNDFFKFSERNACMDDITVYRPSDTSDNENTEYRCLKRSSQKFICFENIWFCWSLAEKVTMEYCADKETFVKVTA